MIYPISYSERRIAIAFYRNADDLRQPIRAIYCHANDLRQMTQAIYYRANDLQ
mgnify:CR=1 FL=1